MAREDHQLDHLLALMARLREPGTGCPWDLEQSYKTIAPSTIEEAYEVVDAIDREDFEHLREELGDLLFQVVFYSQLAREEDRFDFHDIVSALTAKLLRRHPHVFPDGTLQSRRNDGEEPNPAQVSRTWERTKQQERAEKGAFGVLDDIPVALPAATRAAKLQKRAARCGFDWVSPHGVVEQVEEELREVKEALATEDQSALEEEIGDLMFTVVNLARHLKLDPETTLRGANHKFERRFRFIEAHLREMGETPQSATTEAMEHLWQQAKLAGL